jgi:hypothetical protein
MSDKNGRSLRLWSQRPARAPGVPASCAALGLAGGTFDGDARPSFAPTLDVGP